MKHRFHLIVPCLVLITLLATGMEEAVSGEATDLTIYTTDAYAPYNFVEQGKLKGISVDIMVRILEKTGRPLKCEAFEIVPWARGLIYLSTKPNACLLTVGKTPERKEKFQWVGPTVLAGFSVLALHKRHIKINAIADLNTYRIGEQLGGSPGGEVALKAGVRQENMEYAPTPRQNIQKLAGGRLDVIIIEKNVAAWCIKRLGLHPDDFETVYVLSESPMYFGFHKDIPKALIQQLQATLDNLKQQEEYQTILNTYLK